MNARTFGGILLALGLVSSIELVRAGVPHVILAFCYIGLSIAAIGFFLRRAEIVYGYVAVALIAQVPFAIDLVRLYLGYPQLIGLVDYDPFGLSVPSRIVDLIVHVVTLPIAIIGLMRLEPAPYHRFVQTYAIVASVLFVLSFVITGGNCTRIGCFDTLPAGGTLAGHLFYASLLWVVLPLISGYGVARVHERATSSRTSSSSRIS